MNEVDHKINKDMNDTVLIDVESMDFSDNQTWLYKIPGDSGQKLDLKELNLALNGPNEDEYFLRQHTALNKVLDSNLKDEVATPDKHNIDVETKNPQLEDAENTEWLSSEHVPFETISNSQPAHTFADVVMQVVHKRFRMNIFQEEFLMSMSPPSLVSSTLMENSGLPTSGRESINPMMTSMALSILDKASDKDLCNSFTKRDLIENSESNTKSKEEACQIDTVKVLNENSDSNIGVPQPKNNPKSKPNGEINETITLHYANNKFKRDNDAEKENLNRTFQTDETFFKEMSTPKTGDQGKNSLNLTMDKHELDNIIQARQKLSLPRKLPTEPDKPSHTPNQVDTSPVKTIQFLNQKITVPRLIIENATELLSGRGAMNNYEGSEEHARETPKRNATFERPSPETSAMDATVVYTKADENNIIEISSDTSNLIDSEERTMQREARDLQDRAMVGPSEGTSTDTGNFRPSSPPERVPDTINPRCQIASTPMAFINNSINDYLNIHDIISPIYDTIDDKSPTMINMPCKGSDMKETYNMNTKVVNSGTNMKKTSAKRDILPAKNGPEKKLTSASQIRPVASRISPTDNGLYSAMPPPAVVPRKAGLPISKLRQYSSHKELNRIPSTAAPTAARVTAGQKMLRKGVYASNPALSPTTGASQKNNMGIEKQDRPILLNRPALVKQDTRTLRRERPQCQLVAPKNPTTSRPFPVAGSSQLKVSRPTSVPQKPATVPAPQVGKRPATGMDRISELARPPARRMRPPV